MLFESPDIENPAIVKKLINLLMSIMDKQGDIRNYLSTQPDSPQELVSPVLKNLHKNLETNSQSTPKSTVKSKDLSTPSEGFTLRAPVPIKEESSNQLLGSKLLDRYNSSSSSSSTSSVTPSRHFVRPPTPLRADPYSILEHVFRGKVFAPGHKKYDLLRSMYNRDYNHLPSLIVQPMNNNDIITAIKFSKTHGWKLSVKSRGYSTAGHSVGTDTLLIDMSKMNGIFVDRKFKTVTAQAGASWIDIHRAVAPWWVVGPTDCSVGCGALLGGGVGPLLNTHGLCMDALISVDLITNNGEHKIVSATDNEEFFWALKGAGNLSFGIVTSYTVEIFEDKPRDLYSLTRTWSLENAPAILRLCMKLFDKDLNRQVYTLVKLSPEGLTMENLYLGEVAKGEEACTYYSDPNYPPATSQSNKTSFLEWNECHTSKDTAHKFIYKSGLLHNIDEDIIDTIVTLASNYPAGGKMEFTLDLFFGAVTDFGLSYAAFPHRRKSINLVCKAQYRSNDEEWKMWSEEFLQCISHKRTGVLLNYADPTLRNSEYPHLYWGENFSLLQELKNTCDPAEFFSHPQSVKVSLRNSQ
eukprot:TRINITY_DN5974_c0_g1_i3.p1 TRINITY_DN5974_c0_g1~~TRINITY_DN5974_c0_g1_i3.p1  ORF type:complete len:580 (+),score=85.57 TRINITY_DN5974_c0_g1_i3:349-2088(+)